MTLKEAFRACQQSKKTQPNLTHKIAYSNYKGFYVSSQTPELSFIKSSLDFFKLSSETFGKKIGIKYGE